MSLKVYVVIKYVDYPRGITEVDSVWNYKQNAETRAAEIDSYFDEIQIFNIEDI